MRHYPDRAVKTIKEGFRIYPYSPGTEGTSVAAFLAGRAPLAPPAPRPETTFHEGSGLSFNTVPPNDYTFWDTTNELVQHEPVGAGQPHTLGLLASFGITKGKPFAPDDRLRGILEDAVAVGNATARTVSFAPREEEGFTYYEDSNWFNMLFVGGYEFLDPPPQITPNGVVPSRSDWARKLNRTRRSSTPTPGSRPRRACGSPGWGRST